MRKDISFIENVSGYVFTSVQTRVHSAITWFNNGLNFFADTNKLKDNNKSLYEENEYLKQENKRLMLLNEENKKLTELLEIEQRYKPLDISGAYVIAKDYNSSFYEIFVINKGTSHDVYKNSVVITNKGLVGRVIETGSTYSRVSSLIELDSSIAAKSVRTDDIGFVRGDFELIAQGLAKMEYLSDGADVLVGDEIVTSHLSDVYPASLPIGVVEEVKIDLKTLKKTAVIRPYEDLRHVDTVLIFRDVELYDN
jgi:rod shape-determining protein MreC